MPRLQFDHADYVVLVVDDLDRSLTFYTETIGLALSHRADRFAQLDTGATRIAIYERSAMEDTLGMDSKAPAPDAPGFELGFKVDDVDATVDTIRDRVDVVCEPTTRPWGQRTAYVGDPDGHLVEFAQDLPREWSGSERSNRRRN